MPAPGSLPAAKCPGLATVSPGRGPLLTRAAPAFRRKSGKFPCSSPLACTILTHPLQSNSLSFRYILRSGTGQPTQRMPEPAHPGKLLGHGCTRIVDDRIRVQGFCAQRPCPQMSLLQPGQNSCFLITGGMNFSCVSTRNTAYSEYRWRLRYTRLFHNVSTRTSRGSQKVRGVELN